MTFYARQADTGISRLHNVAIREEIGERLAIEMRPKLSGIPLNLKMVVEQLRNGPSLNLCLPNSLKSQRRLRVEKTNLSGAAN